MDEFEKKARELPQHRFVHDAIPEIAQALREAVEAEREACADIAEHLNGWGHPPSPKLADHIAQAIRSRGQ